MESRRESKILIEQKWKRHREIEKLKNLISNENEREIGAARLQPSTEELRANKFCKSG